MSWRKLLFWIHLVTGCTAGAIILVMSVTGSLLAFKRQVINWCDRDYRSPPSAGNAARLPVEAMMAAIIAQYHATPSAITIHFDPAEPAEAVFGRDHVFLIDSHTGNVLGESAPRARLFFQQMENWHRWLGAGTEKRATARAVTGACNLGFLVLVISGPFLWMPRRWSWRSVRAVAAFQRGLSGRARDFNWHNVIGIWCALPLFLIVLSGVVMSYSWANNLLYRVTGSEPPAQRAELEPRQREQTRRGEKVEPGVAGLDRLWARAEQQVTGWRSVTLRISPPQRAPIAFTIDTGGGGRPDQRSQLTLNRSTAELVRWEPFSSYNTGRRLRSWLRFLHTGEAGGIGGQTLAGMASTGAAVLVGTGLCLAWRRVFKRS